MKVPNSDFCGYATKNDLRCSDGRIIRHDAFKKCNGKKVPLVWQHGHNDVDNILGHALLENRSDGVYAYGFFNDTDQAANAKELLKHGDINAMSIYANELKQRGSDVVHGNIVEVSLVLSGANPGALIENVSIQHSDGEYTDLDDEAVIHSNIPIDKEQDVLDENKVKEIFDTLTDEQKEAVYVLIGLALDEAPGAGKDDADATKDDADAKKDDADAKKDDADAKKDDADADKDPESADDEEDPDKEKKVAHSNVFDKVSTMTGSYVNAKGKRFSHSDLVAIADESVAFAMDRGLRLKDALAHAEKTYGIKDPTVLFPNAQSSGKPVWVKPEDNWVPFIIDKAGQTPFARLKSYALDLTEKELIARGYITATQKKDGVYAALSRETTPQTVYVRSKLDRDDILDSTEHDIVSYTQEAMRVRFRYDLAKAILVGDGRKTSDPDKINEMHIRPIASDDGFYTVPVELPTSYSSEQDKLASSALVSGAIDAIVYAQKDYKGSGNPTLFVSQNFYTSMLLAKDEASSYRRLYATKEELSSALQVSDVVPVEFLGVGDYAELQAILVNMSDYVIGRDKGGEIVNFDDFDIDFNQYKYLMETRLSGALVVPKSAMVFLAASPSTRTTPSGK